MPPSPGSGLQTRLWGDPQRVAIWRVWRTANHPWWQQLVANQWDPDLGEQATLRAAITGEAADYALAWGKVRAFLGVPGADAIRERFPDLGWLYAHLRQGLTEAQRQEFVTAINRWAEHALANNQWGPNTRLDDSDQLTGTCVGLLLAMEATRAENPRAAEFLAHPTVARWQRQIETWITGAARDGVWIESSRYNLGTMQFLVLASAQLDWPLVDAYVSQVAAAQLWDVTPDLRWPVEWGDVQEPGGLVPYRRQALLWMLSGLPGEGGAKVKQLATELSAHSDPWAKRISPRAFLVGQPDREGLAWKADGARFFGGQGLLIHRAGASQFQAQMQPWPGVDHQVLHLGDWALYANGEWVVPHPVTYDMDGAFELGNTLVLYGQTSMREARGWVELQRPAGLSILTGWMGGNRYYGGVWNAPNRFLHEWSRTLAFLPPGVVVVFDRIRMDDPTAQLARFHQDDRARLTAHPPLVGYLKTPGTATVTGRTASWQTSGGQRVFATWLLPLDSQLRAESGRLVWTPGATRPLELALTVVSLGPPAEAVVDGAHLTITQTGQPTRRFTLDRGATRDLPNSTYDAGGRLVTTPGLIEQFGRPDILTVETP